jgi:hypothetical protein
MANFIKKNKMKMLLRFSKILFGIIILACAASITACHKEGTGGKSAVSGSVKHHEMFIPNAVVYIKYGAKDFPGTNTSEYDNSVTADAEAHFEFRDFRKGDYYLYAIGYDNQILANVSGGIAVTLKYNKESFTDIPVTE